ncbi:antibiotic biosynthesis monooxygenase family protein [Elioraea rosea]|uniref:antibiotic biosynthesis monooxygenase family protein n=1 Tax=Elioraea rosea TaxID=2492390 RepID=UPI0011820EF0|nr:antibiotic biosynthesis monooxygenase family protein [Elioraea rosea]
MATKRGLAATLLAALVGGCAIATPFRSTAGGGDGGAPAVVALTEATLGPDSAARSAFWEGVWAVERTLKDQPGLIGYSVRRELLGNRTWTMTMWETEADLDRFVLSPAHRAAMASGRAALTGTRFARLERRRGDGPPSWAEALDVLGRTREGYR